jgi:hypothetical protein
MTLKHPGSVLGGILRTRMCDDLKRTEHRFELLY